MRRPRGLVLVAVASSLVLAGCSDGGGGETDPAPTGRDSSASSAGAVSQGPTPQELSQQVLDAASDATKTAPVARGTGTPESGKRLTIEVISVERLPTSTLVRLRLSGEGQNVGGPADFGDARDNAVNFTRSLRLVDSAVSKVRYQPWNFEDYRTACTCVMTPLTATSTPQLVTALYPPLAAEVSTVDLDANGFLTIEDIPVTG